MSCHPELSIIVCTRNGASTLRRTLASLAGQTIDRKAYEVIVVDDGSADASAVIAQEAGVRVVRLDRSVGLAAARNAGIGAAVGSIVAFTDDDCEAAPGWAQALLNGFDHATVGGVGGRVDPASSSAFVQRFLTANNPLVPLSADLLASSKPGYRLLLYVRRLLSDGTTLSPSLYSVVGANMAFRRQLLVALDGFDEAFRFGSEEEDLCMRLHQRCPGLVLRYVPDASVTHWFRPRIGDSIRRSRSYGRGNARRALKHSDARLIVYPAPLLSAFLTVAAVAVRRRFLLAAAAVMPLLAYPRWVNQVWRTGSPEPVLYPYLTLAQEVAGMLGELDGLRVGYERVPSTHLARAGTSTICPGEQTC